MNPVHTFQTGFSRFIFMLSSHLYISLSSVLLSSGPLTEISTHPITIYVVKSINYESQCYTVCLPSCHFLSHLSVLHYTTHFTSLICRHFSQFMHFVCKRIYTSCEALTVALLCSLPGCDRTLFGFTA